MLKISITLDLGLKVKCVLKSDIYTRLECFSKDFLVSAMIQKPVHMSDIER